MLNRFAYGMLLCAGVLLWCGGMRAAEGKQDVPETIQPPKGAKLLYSAQATGVQIYTGVMREGKAVWELKAPRAELTVGAAAWKHYAGPTWEAADGSKIKKMGTAGAVTQAPAPQPDNDIPWLLIKVQPEGDKTGELTRIQYVQRVLTKGGLAPAAPPKAEGEVSEVPYSAAYNFYEYVK